MPTPVPDDLPRSPTGRVPRWVLDEAHGRPRADTAFRQWSLPGSPQPGRPGAAPRPRGRGPRRRVARVLALLLVPVALALAGLGYGARTDAATDDAGTDGRPVPFRTGGSSYAFVHTDPLTGEPVGYDPCLPIDVEVRPDGAPLDGQAMIEEALDSVAAASGLTFRLLGSTDRAPSRLAVRPQVDQPVLIAWSSPQESPDLDGDVAGYAGSLAAQGPVGGRAYLRTGEVVLDGPELAPYVSTPQGRAAVVGVITHEVGHLVGLDHVDDPGELMHPQAQPGTTRMGPGDLTGLRTLGSIPCET